MCRFDRRVNGARIPLREREQKRLKGGFERKEASS